MAKSSVIPFGPQHPVLPEPLHLDLIVEDEKVIKAVPQIGFVHRGLEKMVEKYDYHQFIYFAERICGICAFGHTLGYAETVEKLMNVEVPERGQYLRVILSANQVGGVKRDIENSELSAICDILDGLKPDYAKITNTLLKDSSIKNRCVGVGTITKEEAQNLSMVGPFGRASGLEYDVRSFGKGAYANLDSFEPITSNEGDCYARIKVRMKEVLQSIDIIKQMVDKIPDGEIAVTVKGDVPDRAQASNVLEQPRGECYYYARGNGTVNLARMRMRTPTSQNIAGMTAALQGCDLADVNMIILTIDPCISCTER